MGDPIAPSCQNLVNELFGGDVADEQKVQLIKNIQTMIKQVFCNVMELHFFKSHPDRSIVAEFSSTENKNVYAFAHPNTSVAGKRVFYTGLSWCNLTPLDRGCTFVHESSHAVIDTDAVEYDPIACASLEWTDAVRNTQSYAVFCQRAFCACLSGEMLQIAPPMESFKPNWDTRTGDLEHTPGAFKAGEFLLLIVGDIYGDRYSNPGAKIYHKIVQQVQVLNCEPGSRRFMTSHSGLGLSDHPASSTSYKGKKIGEERSEEYVTIGDGLNTSFVKMLSPDVGIGLCECGGQGGRSIEFWCRDAKVSDGKVNR